ncbi:MAG: hypothetical protein Q7Q71_09855 [Verrucomicrobiota bacterium JB023]|nr:hypothetical protein [Verrucomicrobiota bacterium JB023]
MKTDSSLAPPPSSSPVKKALKTLLIICAVGIPVYALFRNLPAVIEATRSADFLAVTYVGLGLLVYTIVNASIWADVLKALGWRGDRLLATRTWIQCEAMKWLPGGIWGYASRVVKAPEIGTNRTIAGASLMAELLLTIAAWAILAAVGLWLDGVLLDRLRETVTSASGSERGHFLFWAVPVFALLGVGLLVSLPPVRRFIIKKLSPLSIASWRVGPLVQAFVSYLALCALHAILLVILVSAIKLGEFTWASAAAADGSAWLIGFFAIGVPGGIGVREAGITWFLSSYMSTPEAMAVAVLWRTLQVLAELAALFLSSLLREPTEKKNLLSEASSEFPSE